MSDEQKQKISQALKGRSKTETHKANIAQGEKEYWAKIPTGEEEPSMIDTGEIV